MEFFRQTSVITAAAAARRQERTNERAKHRAAFLFLYNRVALKESGRQGVDYLL
jgi:hypothetical protein